MTCMEPMFVANDLQEGVIEAICLTKGACGRRPYLATVEGFLSTEERR